MALGQKHTDDLAEATVTASEESVRLETAETAASAEVAEVAEVATAAEPAAPATSPTLADAEAALADAEEAAEEYRAKAQASKQEIKKTWITFGASGVIVLALVVVFLATLAWFANNNHVQATGMEVQAEDPEASLFIAKGATPDRMNYTQVSMTLFGNLYPASTLDCTNWYIENTWDDDEAYVTEYKDVTSGITLTDKTGETGSQVGLFDANSYTTSVAAYNVSTYCLYTSKSGATLDVYLNETEPIKVSYTGTRVSRDLLSALRIGLVVDGSLQFVYVPAAESASGDPGNSSGTVAGKYYAVKGTATSDLSKDGDSDFYTFYMDSTISPITATKNEDGSYTAASDHKKICSAGYDGKVVKVYAWLEGTDSQALLGISDGDTAGISVLVNFVGVATTE